jgi:hypothetical protein
MRLLPRKPNSDLSAAKKSYIWTFYKKGNTLTEIHRKTKISRFIIFSFLIWYAKSKISIFESKPVKGCKPKLDSRAKRALVRVATTDIRITLKTFSTFSKSSKKLNYYTVAKILKKHGKTKYRPRKKPYLSPLYIKKRREYCRRKKILRRNPRRVC